MGFIVLRTARDIGALLRDARKRAKLDQATLAERIGVSRKWVIDAEGGNPGAAIGTLLRALGVVGVDLTVEAPALSQPEPRAPPALPVVDLDQVVNATRKQGGKQSRKR